MPVRRKVLLLLPWVALLALAALRICWINAYPLDSDEAQHAHVAWAWTQGLVPYRDVFDNHGPLFSLFYSGVLRLVGERADVLSWLRLAVQPWYCLAIGALYVMGQRLYGRKVAWVACLLTAFYPRFFLTAGQFRTDDLWMAAWLAALAVALAANGRRWMWFVAGLLAGAGLCVSQKTLVLLATAAVAAAIVALARRSSRDACDAMPWLAVIAGVAVLPPIFIGWLWHANALDAAWYCLVTYNIGPTGSVAAAPIERWSSFAILAVLAVTLCIRSLRSDGSAIQAWRCFVGLQATLFLLLIWFVWPLITRQDFLPAVPPLILLVCGWVAGQRWLSPHPWWLGAAACIVVAFELHVVVDAAPPGSDALAGQRSEMATVLSYSAHGDSVMDAKGESIFRPRPYYPVIETMALSRFRHNLTADTIAAAMVSHQSMMAIRGRLPLASDRFVLRNFLPAGYDIWIAGEPVPGIGSIRRVDVRQPGTYTLSDGRTPLVASVDGKSAAASWNLGVGEHTVAFAPRDASAEAILVSAEAWSRGWRPTLPLVSAESLVRDAKLTRAD